MSKETKIIIIVQVVDITTEIFNPEDLNLKSLKKSSKNRLLLRNN